VAGRRDDFLEIGMTSNDAGESCKKWIKKELFKIEERSTAWAIERYFPYII